MYQIKYIYVDWFQRWILWTGGHIWLPYTHSSVTMEHIYQEVSLFQLVVFFVLFFFQLSHLSYMVITDTSFVFPSAIHPTLAFNRWISSRMKQTHLTLRHYRDYLEVNKTRLYKKQYSNYNEYTFQLSKHVQLATLSLKHFGKWDVGSDTAADVFKKIINTFADTRFYPSFNRKKNLVLLNDKGFWRFQGGWVQEKKRKW